MELKAWLFEFIRHPAWASYRFRAGVTKHLDHINHSVRTAELETLALPFLEGISKATNRSQDFIESLVKAYDRPLNTIHQTDIPARWAASPVLLKTYQSICAIKKPEYVVETGVATGISSSVILNVLSENGSGHLYSVELPPIGRKDISYIGSSIPECYKARWKLRLGPSVIVLAKIAKEIGRFDIFIHDSDHSYWNQKAEYELALRFLKRDGILISDDVHNDSFLEFAEEHSLHPIVISRDERGGFIGILSNNPG